MINVLNDKTLDSRIYIDIKHLFYMPSVPVISYLHIQQSLRGGEATSLMCKIENPTE